MKLIARRVLAENFTRRLNMLLLEDAYPEEISRRRGKVYLGRFVVKLDEIIVEQSLCEVWCTPIDRFADWCRPQKAI